MQFLPYLLAITSSGTLGSYNYSSLYGLRLLGSCAAFQYGAAARLMATTISALTTVSNPRGFSVRCGCLHLSIAINKTKFCGNNFESLSDAIILAILLIYNLIFSLNRFDSGITYFIRSHRLFSSIRVTDKQTTPTGENIQQNNIRSPGTGPTAC